MDQQSQWAISLQKTRQSQLQGQTKPLVAQLREINEALTYFKLKLREVVDKNESEKIRKYFDILIKNRSKQTAILLAINLEKKPTDENKLRAIVKKFYHDCNLLQKAVAQYLTI